MSLTCFKSLNFLRLWCWFLLQHEITNALFSRVKFFRLFFMALLSFSKEKVSEKRMKCGLLSKNQIEICNLSLKQIFKIAWKILYWTLHVWSGCPYIFQCEGIPQAQKLISQLLELLPTIKETICMGIQPESQEVGKNGQ